MPLSIGQPDGGCQRKLMYIIIDQAEIATLPIKNFMPREPRTPSASLEEISLQLKESARYIPIEVKQAVWSVMTGGV